MKSVITAVGGLIALAGLVFFLQGTNILPVGGMAGQGQWTVIGLIMVVIGVAIGVVVSRSSRNTPN